MQNKGSRNNGTTKLKIREPRFKIKDPTKLMIKIKHNK